VYENKTIKEMKDIIKIYAQDTNFTDCDCFICVFLSHGRLECNKEYIYGTDQSIMFHEHYTDIFKTTKTLIGKPKIFFMDLCRGNENEPIYSKSNDNNLLNISKTNQIDEPMQTLTRYLINI